MSYLVVTGLPCIAADTESFLVGHKYEVSCMCVLCIGHCVCLLLCDRNVPLPSNRQYLSCDACLDVNRDDSQNCSMLCCI